MSLVLGTIQFIFIYWVVALSVVISILASGWLLTFQFCDEVRIVVSCAIYTNFLGHLQEIPQVNIFRIKSNIELTSLFELNLRLINLRLARVYLFTLTTDPCTNFLSA